MAEKQLDINEIRKILPHRYPFLLIDRVLDYEIGKTLKALKNVTANEPFFSGAFPALPSYAGRAHAGGDGAVMCDPCESGTTG